jgi:hypothetical protein
MTMLQANTDCYTGHSILRLYYYYFIIYYNPVDQGAVSHAFDIWVLHCVHWCT